MPDLIAFYLRYHNIQGHTEATIRSYRIELSNFQRFLEGRGHSLEAGEITSLDVLDHLQDLQIRGRKPRTIRSRHTAITTFLNWAVQWEIISANPAKKIPAPKVPKTYKSFLKKGQFQSLVRVCPANTFTGARRRSMLQILNTTGMRKKELSSLMLDGLDWDIGFILIRSGKGQKDRRTPFHAMAQMEVLRYLSFRQDDLPQLWMTEERRPLTYNGIGQDMKRLVERAGLRGQIEDMFHIFRRTFAGNAVKQRIPRQYIMAATGWSSTTMLDHYTQAMREEEGAIEA